VKQRIKIRPQIEKILPALCVKISVCCAWDVADGGHPVSPVDAIPGDRSSCCRAQFQAADL
jgi:hypothetical protein